MQKMCKTNMNVLKSCQFLSLWGCSVLFGITAKFYKKMLTIGSGNHLKASSQFEIKQLWKGDKIYHKFYWEY